MKGPEASTWVQAKTPSQPRQGFLGVHGQPWGRLAASAIQEGCHSRRWWTGKAIGDEGEGKQPRRSTFGSHSGSQAKRVFLLFVGLPEQPTHACEFAGEMWFNYGCELTILLSRPARIFRRATKKALHLHARVGVKSPGLQRRLDALVLVVHVRERHAEQFDTHGHRAFLARTNVHPHMLA